MEIPLFIRGVIIGFSIAAPVGPIGVLCIKRSLSDGFAAGLCSGVGAAMADAVYGSVAAMGVVAVSSILISTKWWLQVIGGLFLIYLGCRTIYLKPIPRTSVSTGTGLLLAFLSTFFLTITNPMTILSFAAVFAGIGAGNTEGVAGVAFLVSGVFVGSVCWWLLLSGGVSVLRERINERALAWVNRGSGLLICGFGVWSLLACLKTG